MQSLRDTWLYWYENHKKGEVKTLKEGIVSFFDLFTQPQKDFLRNEVNLNDFFKTIEAKANEPLGTDSKRDIDTAENYVKEYNAKRELRKQGN
jgi:hypothetical protein